MIWTGPDSRFQKATKAKKIQFGAILIVSKRTWQLTRLKYTTEMNTGLTCVFFVLEHQLLQLRGHRWFGHVFVQGFSFVLADALERLEPVQRPALVIGDQLVDASLLLRYPGLLAHGPRFLRGAPVIALQRFEAEQQLPAVVSGNRSTGRVVS